MKNNLKLADKELQYKNTESWKKIQAIDLCKVMERVKKDNSDKNISDVGYRQFLYLISESDRLQLKLKLIPTKIIDEVWHAHILHTQKYAEDCRQALGYFVHHSPDSKEDTNKNNENAFTETMNLANKIFGKASHYNFFSKSKARCRGGCATDCGRGSCGRDH